MPQAVPVQYPCPTPLWNTLETPGTACQPLQPAHNTPLLTSASNPAEVTNAQRLRQEQGEEEELRHRTQSGTWETAGVFLNDSPLAECSIMPVPPPRTPSQEGTATDAERCAARYLRDLAPWHHASLLSFERAPALLAPARTLYIFIVSCTCKCYKSSTWQGGPLSTGEAQGHALAAVAAGQRLRAGGRR